MLSINKTKKQDYTVYTFIGSIQDENIHKVAMMIEADINKTYRFIFDFSEVDYITIAAVKVLQKLYIHSVEYNYEIIIENIHMQPKMMLDIFQVSSLYITERAVNGANYESLYSA